MSVGKTKDAGWEIGVSRTVAHPAAEVWDLLTSRDGLAIWLGEGVVLPASKGTRYETSDGTVGEIRSYHALDRVRLTWQPADWDHDSTVQVAIGDRGDRTLLRFHQERLASAQEREAQREHWQGVMDRIVAALDA